MDPSNDYSGHSASHLQTENSGLQKFSLCMYGILWIGCLALISFVAMSSSSQVQVICLFVCWCTSQKVKSSISNLFLSINYYYTAQGMKLQGFYTDATMCHFRGCR